MVSSFFLCVCIFKDDKCYGKVNTQEFVYFYFKISSLGYRGCQHSGGDPEDSWESVS